MEIKNIYQVQEEYEDIASNGEFIENELKHELLLSKEHDRLEKQAERIRQKAAERLQKDLEADKSGLEF